MQTVETVLALVYVQICLPYYDMYMYKFCYVVSGHKVTTEGGERATKSLEVVEQLTSLLTSIVRELCVERS